MDKAELHIEVDADLLRVAREAGLNVADLAENALRDALRKIPAAAAAADERARQWAEDNAEAIDAHRARIAEYGVFGDDLRSW